MLTRSFKLFGWIGWLCMSLVFESGNVFSQTFNTKSRRHTVHQLQKEGWSCINAASMEQMLNNSLIKQQQLEANGLPMFLTADGSSVGGTKDQAVSQALEMARLQLAGLMETQMHVAVQASLTSLSINNEVKTSVVNIIQSSYHNFVSKLPYLEPEWLIFRELPGKKTEAVVRIFCKRKESEFQWNTFLMQELKDKLQLSDDQIRTIVKGEE